MSSRNMGGDSNNNKEMDPFLPELATITEQELNDDSVISAPIASLLPSPTQLRQKQQLSSSSSSSPLTRSKRGNCFDLDVALYCAGLAFDAYVEPPPESSRWERGSKGWKVAFVSPTFTRSLYSGLVQVVLHKITDLPSRPEQENMAEQIVTGSGIDACLLVAIVEGSWKEDIERIEKEPYHEGVLDLTGAAHVGRSSTAWSNVDQRASQMAYRQRGMASPYHIPATWGKGAQAIWPDPILDPIPSNKNNGSNNSKTTGIKDNQKTTSTTKKGSNTGDGMIRSNSFYLYVQDPATARIVFTVADDNRIGDVLPIGSTYKRLTNLIPRAANTPDQWLQEWKKQVLEEQKQKLLQEKLRAEKESDLSSSLSELRLDTSNLQASWEGELPLTTKPRKRDKQGQMMTGAAAGAVLAGPMGAAAGALLMGLYEGEVRGRINVKLNYLPILPQQKRTGATTPYQVLGGMPGINWGRLFEKYQEATAGSDPPLRTPEDIGEKVKRIRDLEHCFFVNHDVTGATCAVYRSMEQKVVIVSFRGTCAPVDLLTDSTITQDAWVEGEDVGDPKTAKVHTGFRNSMNSIARRLKELILAIPGDEDLSSFDMLVTGHSLGGALATLFTADIGQFGVDAGRALPQLEPSDPWWKSIAAALSGRKELDKVKGRGPPRPKSLHLYNFGSPRVGNDAFRDLVDSLLAESKIDQVYRIVNGEDVVARMPRTMNALAFGNVNYEHVGPTVLVSEPEQAEVGDALIWVEGESDDNTCPVRDGVALINPLSEGTLLADLLKVTQATLDSDSSDQGKKDLFSKWAEAASKVTERVKSLTPSDIASVVGINKDFTEREVKLIQSLLQGKALNHHMEDRYYQSMGRASGFVVAVGEEITKLDFPDSPLVAEN